MKTLATALSAMMITLLTVSAIPANAGDFGQKFLMSRLFPSSHAQGRNDDYDNHGQSLCQFGDRILAPTGFVQGGVYTTESIQQVLSDMHVKAHAVRPLVPGCHYQVNYSCSVYNRLATGSFLAMPVPPVYKGEEGALVQWEFSKFFPL